ncbi:hypothetical protein RvY_05068-2 [Ramazzottius varieornatus]|uniref:Uncharacterized protein n=1 Tax=Ramazzottius varieornatus TaxID=947166 RepID=A0A1D1UWW3_RAMVA|nr:hypothetical protein RvY_05068-2 [Ramazzottius varieornatus]
MQRADSTGVGFDAAGGRFLSERVAGVGNMYYAHRTRSPSIGEAERASSGLFLVCLGGAGLQFGRSESINLPEYSTSIRPPLYAIDLWSWSRSLTGFHPDHFGPHMHTCA